MHSVTMVSVVNILLMQSSYQEASASKKQSAFPSSVVTHPMLL